MTGVPTGRSVPSTYHSTADEFFIVCECQGSRYLLRTAVVKHNIVLDIEISSPVTNLRGTGQFGDFDDRVITLEMDSDALLLAPNKFLRCRLGDILVWAVSQGSSGLGDRVLQGESFQPLGPGEGVNLRRG